MKTIIKFEKVESSGSSCMVLWNIEPKNCNRAHIVDIQRSFIMNCTDCKFPFLRKFSIFTETSFILYIPNWVGEPP